MANLMSDFSNEIYDAQAALGDVNLVKSHGVCPYTVFLGVFVSLIPKIIPRILPNFIAQDELREKFDEEAYREEVETMFREKFSQNLEMFEKVIRAWKDNTLDLENYGLNLNPDSPLAKEDLVAGEPESFQDDLLKGIKFLQYRVSRMNKPDDRIEQMADLFWTVSNRVYDAVYNVVMPIMSGYRRKAQVEDSADY